MPAELDPIVPTITDHCGEVDGRDVGPGGISANQNEKGLDEVGQPIGFGERGVHPVAVVIGRLQGLEAQAQRGERGAELMRGIGHEPALTAGEHREPLGCGIELFAEGDQLRGTINGTNPCIEVPFGQAFRRVFELAHRPSHAPSQQQSHAAHGGEYDPR